MCFGSLVVDRKIGLLLASCVDEGTHNRDDTGSYRIPIALQFLWAIILAFGLFFLPDSPRWYVKEGRLDDARKSLSTLRGQPTDSDYISDELQEIVANYEYELTIGQASWLDSLRGWGPAGNGRRVFIGVFLQMFQQLTGINLYVFFWHLVLLCPPLFILTNLCAASSTTAQLSSRPLVSRTRLSLPWQRT